MRLWRSEQRSARIGRLLWIGAVAVGFLPVLVQADTGTPPVLRPWVTLEWSIAAQGSPTPMVGQSIVGPAGTVELGPYGSVAIAGQTPEQARVTIEKHLARFVRYPRVTVRLVRSADEEAADEGVAMAGLRPEAGPAGQERGPAAEEPNGAPDMPAQLVPGTWRPRHRPGDADSGTMIVGPWRPLLRASAPGEVPVVVGQTRPFPAGSIAVPGPVMPTTVRTDPVRQPAPFTPLIPRSGAPR